MSVITLEAKKRDGLKKEASKRLRRDGFIPSVIYGQGENRNIMIDSKIFGKLAPKLTKSTVINLKLDGQDYDVLIKEYQKNYVKDQFLHIDFYELKAGKLVHFRIPINFIGSAKGVREGGTLEKHLIEIEVECLPKNIVHHFEVNIEEMEINDTLHVKDVNIDTEKYKILSNLDDVVIHIAGKQAEEKLVEDEAEAEIPAEAAKESSEE